MEKVFRMPKRKWEADVHHHRKSDDFGGRFEIVKWAAFFHTTRLGRDLPGSRQFPLTVPFALMGRKYGPAEDDVHVCAQDQETRSSR